MEGAPLVIKPMKCDQFQYWPGSVCELQVGSSPGILLVTQVRQAAFKCSLWPIMWLRSLAMLQVSQRCRCNKAEAWYSASVYQAGLLTNPSCSVPNDH